MERMSEGLCISKKAMGMNYITEMNTIGADYPENHENIRRLIQNLQYSSDDTSEIAPVRLSAVQALGNLKDENTIQPLMEALSDPINNIGVDFTNPDHSPCVASEVIHTLADLNAKQAIPIIISLLSNKMGHKNDVIRIEAARALGVLHASEALMTLIRKAKETGESKEVRSMAIWALGEIGDQSIISVLQGLNEYGDRLQPAVYAALIKLNHK
jgi:HEAT repeat protein